LLQILGRLYLKKHIRLASPYFQPLKGDLNEKRIIRVCRYILENSAEEVSMDHASTLIHLSKTAFCKFFKRTTGKTFSDYVNEIRIGHACHLILESDKPIAEICSRTGFESITYFNRVFLRKQGVSPKYFRKLQTADPDPQIKKRSRD
jgi:AraC-like DNA-binding protein